MPLIRKDVATTAITDPLPWNRADLKSSSGETRWAAARQLSHDSSNVEALGEALAIESDPRVREALFSGLAHIQTPEAVALILPHIRSQDASVRAGALDALNVIPQAVECHLPKLLTDPDPDVRLLACEIVRRLPGPAATRLLCSLLATEVVPNVCGAAVEALSEVGTEDALPMLEEYATRFKSEPFFAFSIRTVATRIAGEARKRGPEIS